MWINGSYESFKKQQNYLKDRMTVQSKEHTVDEAWGPWIDCLEGFNVLLPSH